MIWRWMGIGCSLFSWMSRRPETKLNEMRDTRNGVGAATPATAVAPSAAVIGNGRVLRGGRASSSAALQLITGATPRMAVGTSEPEPGPSSGAETSSAADGSSGPRRRTMTQATPSSSGTGNNVAASETGVRMSTRRRSSARITVESKRATKARRSRTNRLTPARPRRGRGRPKSAQSPTNDEFEVQEIIASGTCYLVRWKGYPREQATWEPQENLHCEALLKAFQKKNAGGGGANRKARRRR